VLFDRLITQLTLITVILAFSLWCLPLRLVLETLETKEASRKAYRLVGGVLVERTVGEVLPSVRQNQAGLRQVLGKLAADLQQKEVQAAKWKVKYGIKTQEDAQAMAGPGARQSTGVLA
jgi:Prefoldin subunit